MLRRGLSPSTVLKVHRILSRALTIAVRRGRIPRNVATLVDAPSAAPHEIEPLTREEARRILDVAAQEERRSLVGRACTWHPSGRNAGSSLVVVDLETGVIQGMVPDPAHRLAARLQQPARVWRAVAPAACKKGCKQHRHLPACEQTAQGRAYLLQASLSGGLHCSRRQMPEAPGRRCRLSATQGQEQAHAPVPAPGPRARSRCTERGRPPSG